MKKESPEKYWKKMLAKQEKGDYREVMNALCKLKELEPAYKDYCEYKKYEEGGEFLGPVIDYNWWKEKIKGKYKIEEKHVRKSKYTISRVFSFKNIYEFEKSVFTAVCTFINAIEYVPDEISFNRQTYIQILYFLTTSPAIKNYEHEMLESELNFQYIAIDYEYNIRNYHIPKIFKRTNSHQTRLNFDNSGYEPVKNKDEMGKLLSQFTKEEECIPNIFNIFNTFGEDYVDFDDEFPDVLYCEINENLKDMEFELVFFAFEDDDEDDFDDDEFPDLPGGGKVKEKELVLESF